MTKQYELKIFNEINNELTEHWLRITSGSNSTVFQSYEWCAEWCRCMKDYLKDTLPFIIVVFFKNEPVALAPFQIQKNWLYSRVDFLGAGLNDYNNILFSQTLVEDPTVLTNIFRRIVEELSKFDLIFFGNVPEYAQNCKNYLVHLPNFKQTIYALRVNALDRDLTEFVPKKVRKQNTRALKKLYELKELKLNENVINYNRDVVISHIIRQKSRQYVRTGAIDIFKSKMIRAFIRKIALNENLSVVSSIHVDGKIIAAHLGFQKDDYFYYYMPVTERQEYSKYSLGNILLQYLMKRGSEIGINFFDFTIGEESYKARWANEKIKLFEYKRANSAVGHLVLSGIRLRNYIKRQEKLRTLFMKTRSILYRQANGNNDQQ